MSKHWHGGTDIELDRLLKHCFCNNYRKMHGLRMRRWVTERRATDKEIVAIYRERKGDLKK